jgi:dihydrofolate reductase/thymidylate synthase
MPLKKFAPLNEPIPNINDKYDGILNLVVAYSFPDQGIGNEGRLPWNIPEDMEHFRDITIPKEETQVNIIVMGRKTWESIPDRFKPLEKRFNVVLSNNKDYCDQQNARYKKKDSGDTIEGEEWNNGSGVSFTTWDDLFEKGGYYAIQEQLKLKVENVKGIKPLNASGFLNSTLDIKYYIIGGGVIYNKALNSGNPVKIHATEVYLASPGTGQSEIKPVFDTYFPKFDATKISSISEFKLSKKCYKSNIEMPIWYRFITYYNTPANDSLQKMYLPYNLCFMADYDKAYKHPENDYLDLMRRIIETGQSTNDRTGVGTMSLFGEMLKYDLRDTFPITTTKRLPLRMVFEELMLYISGKTDNRILQEKDIHIWDGNTSREFLDKRGLTHYQEGDFGETYGFNMRHYGAEYMGCNMHYAIGAWGYDQLAAAINLIKTDPYSRRIIIDLWNPATQHKAALPSCLCKYQFNVNVERRELNLAIYLRSSDYFLANNWNTCTGAFLVHMICNLDGINLTPGMLTVFIADAHIYKFHIEQVKRNLSRSPYAYPKLVYNGGSNPNKKKNIMDFRWEDFELIGYRCHPGIKAEMAV